MLQRKLLGARSKAETRMRISERACRWLFCDSFCLTAMVLTPGRTANMQEVAVLPET